MGRNAFVVVTPYDCLMCSICDSLSFKIFVKIWYAPLCCLSFVMHSMKNYWLWVDIVIYQLIATVLSQIFCAYEPFSSTSSYFRSISAVSDHFNCLAKNLLPIGISVWGRNLLNINRESLSIGYLPIIYIMKKCHFSANWLTWYFYAKKSSQDLRKRGKNGHSWIQHEICNHLVVWYVF